YKAELYCLEMTELSNMPAGSTENKLCDSSKRPVCLRSRRRARLALHSSDNFYKNPLEGNMKKLIGLLAVMFLLQAGSASAEDGSCASWLDVEVTKLNSSEVVDLCAEIGDKPVLLVNTASYCGFTYQFTGLEELYQRYRDRGLVVVGFPSD